MADNVGPDGRALLFSPPPGLTPDFDSPRDAGWRLNLAFLIVCNALVTAFLLVRLYVRCTLNRTVFWDDVTCFFAWILVLLYSATVLVMAHFGLGYHAWELGTTNYLAVLKWLYASSVIYIPAAFFTKVTLLLLIARVFAVEPHVAKGVHIFIWAILFACTPIQTAKILVCTPVHAFWSAEADPSRCLDQRKLFVADLSVAVVTDLVILVLPIPMIWRMRLSWPKKIKIVLMFGAGGVAFGVTLYRMVKAILYIGSKDVTADFVPLVITTIVELSIGLICACLPAFNQLVEHHSTRKRARMANRARSGRWPGGGQEKGVGSWWDSISKSRSRRSAADGLTLTAATGLGRPGLPMAATTTTIAAAKYVNGNDEDTLVLPSSCQENPQSAFDLELAIFTGQRVPGHVCAADSTTVPAQRRISSIDGVREGWLVPGEYPGPSYRARKQGAVEEPEVEYWTDIWDGREECIPRRL